MENNVIINENKQLQKNEELIRLENGVREIQKLADEKNRYYDKYFVADEFEYLRLGIISKKTGLGQDIIEHNNRGSAR